MSDSEKQKNCAEVISNNPMLKRNKFTLIDDGEQLNSIRKLNDSTGGGGDQYCFSDELNNNSIHTLIEGSGFGMDSKIKPSDGTKPTSTTTNTPASAPVSESSTERVVKGLFAHTHKGEEPPSQTPTYTSIFASNQVSYQQQQHQAAQRSGSRGPLRKQDAAELELPVATIERLNQGKKLAYHGNYTKNIMSPEDEDENEDDEIDERLPFSSSMTKRQGSRRVKASPEPQQKMPAKHSLQLQHDNRCEFMSTQQQGKHNPHTKISFNDSRPPSFSTCQSNHHHDSSGKLDWRDQCSHSSCGCYHDPYRSSKKLPINEIAYKDQALNAKYSRTRALHLVLKSIILILLTLLLLMLFIGIILASHYLPQVLDRVLSATRSFNVTIAG